MSECVCGGGGGGGVFLQNKKNPSIHNFVKKITNN